jgi:ubiquinone biosynthesis protein
MDGVGKSLKIDFDIYSILEGDINQIMGSVLTKENLMEEGIWTAKEIIDSLRIIPRQFKWFVKDFSKKKYVIKLEINGQEKLVRQITRATDRLGVVLFSSLLVLSGAIMAKGMVPTDSWRLPNVTIVLWALALALYLSTWIRRKR